VKKQPASFAFAFTYFEGVSTHPLPRVHREMPQASLKQTEFEDDICLIHLCCGPPQSPPAHPLELHAETHRVLRAEAAPFGANAGFHRVQRCHSARYIDPHSARRQYVARKKSITCRLTLRRLRVKT
jgi:hypothetical protein